MYSQYNLYKISFICKLTNCIAVAQAAMATAEIRTRLHIDAQNHYFDKPLVVATTPFVTNTTHCITTHIRNRYHPTFHNRFVRWI